MPGLPNFAYTQRPPVWASRCRPTWTNLAPNPGFSSSLVTYFLVRVVLFVVVVAVIVILVVLVLKVVFLVLVQLLEGQGFAREPVNSPRDELFLDVFAELIIELQPLLDVVFFRIIIVGWWLRRTEEVEK